MELKSKSGYFLNVLKGILLMCFGMIALIHPEDSIVTLATFFGIFLLAGGIVLILNYTVHRRYTNTWLWLTEGGLDILLGAIILAYPLVSTKFFLGILGIWAIFMAMILFFYFARLEYEGSGRNVALSASVVSFLFGVFILINPFQSARFLVSLIGIYALFYGLITLFNTPRPRTA